MAKLYFRYGTVGSAKTLNLLAVAHNYFQQEKNVLLMKPSIDTRFAEYKIISRAGLQKKADYLLNHESVFVYNGKLLNNRTPSSKENQINLDSHRKVSCILIDEVQFLSSHLVEQLHLLTTLSDIPVIAYGLKSNFRGELFKASQRLFELADKITEVKSTCHFCNRKANFNLKLNGSQPTLEGPEFELGAEETYKPACKLCYFEKFHGEESQYQNSLQ